VLSRFFEILLLIDSHTYRHGSPLHPVTCSGITAPSQTSPHSNPFLAILTRSRLLFPPPATAVSCHALEHLVCITHNLRLSRFVPSHFFEPADLLFALCPLRLAISMRPSYVAKARPPTKPRRPLPINSSLTNLATVRMPRELLPAAIYGNKHAAGSA
jgi:hypothetical protein